MSRKRLSKKQLQRDRFVEQTFDWAHWVETHGREVLGGVVVVALLIAGFFVWRSMERGAEEQAARDYIEARQAYFVGNYPLAANDLQSFLDRHDGTSYGDDASFFLAASYYNAGQSEQAIQALRDFLDRHEDSPFASNARRLLAAAYQEAGRYDAAVEAYREAIEAAEFAEVEIQLRRSLADVYEARKQTGPAADQYRQILMLEPEGAVAEEARRELAELTVEPLETAGPDEVTAAAEETGVSAETDPETGAVGSETASTQESTEGSSQ